MSAANPRHDASLQKVLDGLLEDFVLFTKPGEVDNGALVYFAL